MKSEEFRIQIDVLAKLLEDANRQVVADPATLGKCEWTDVNGEQRCNSPWSKFQCEQVEGKFTAGGTCA